MNIKSPHVVELNSICKRFSADHQENILEDVCFKLRENSITAIVGKSGAGKSTLLRIIAGLEKPSSGQVLIHGHEVTQPIPGCSMVFQHFSLLPWLTVLGNVELGLEALGVESGLRRKLALKAIDIVGMDGFEAAYPRELSGGMMQRVGFARSLVVDPDILLMDEPFSALDVLTAEGLRNDLLELWCQQKTQLRCILMVTHNISEAVALADQVIIFDSHPGTIFKTIEVDLPHPRNPSDQAFSDLVEEIYDDIASINTKDRLDRYKINLNRICLELPDVEISLFNGLFETLQSPDYAKEIEINNLAEDLHMDVDALFPLIEAIELLRFGQVKNGHLIFTQAGTAYGRADLLKRKKLFASQLLAAVPLAQYIHHSLKKDPYHRMHEQDLVAYLSQEQTAKESQTTVKVIIEWARYGELFSYDANSGFLNLENPS